MLGVSRVTLRRWEKAGHLVPMFRTTGGHRRYDLKAVRQYAGDSDLPEKTVVYARVSCHDQKDDLERQAGRLEMYCRRNGWHNVEIIRDLGSGLNYGKRGLKRLIGLICSGAVDRIVIEHKDRLLRFGSELLFVVCRLLGVQMVIVEPPADEKSEERLAHDVIELMTVFSAKLYCARSHRKKMAASV